MVVRDPHDVAISFYKFFSGWFFAPGEISLEAFVREFWLARGVPPTEMQNPSYFHHLLSWWEHRADANVLWLHFEDLKVRARDCTTSRPLPKSHLPQTLSPSPSPSPFPEGGPAGLCGAGC